MSHSYQQCSQYSECYRHPHARSYVQIIDFHLIAMKTCEFYSTKQKTKGHFDKNSDILPAEVDGHTSAQRQAHALIKFLYFHLNPSQSTANTIFYLIYSSCIVFLSQFYYS